MTLGSQEAPGGSEEKAGRSDIHPEPAHVAWSPGTARGVSAAGDGVEKLSGSV